MKYILPILCLFVFSCDSDNEIEGCTDLNATNYNPEALIDDSSCECFDFETEEVVDYYE